MHRSVVPATATATLALSLLVSPSASADPPTGADEVRTWNATAMTTLVAEAVAVPEQPLHLAYVHRAVYAGARRAAHRQHPASVPAAVASAAYTVLRHHFPGQRQALDAALATSLSSVTDADERARGTRIGRRAAHRLLDRRAGDGLNGEPLPVPAPAPGVWRPLPPNVVGVSSWLGSVRPFALRSSHQLRPGAPPALGSRRWARAFRETKAVGGAASTVRTPAQTEVARFWSEPPYVQNQQGLRGYSERAGLGAVATARLFALADTAAADGLIACWDAKHAYTFWRPATAVPGAGTDGNPATTADPSWTPLLAVTPNHPEYPSAHSCATTAFARVVSALGHGRLDLDLASPLTGTTRHYSSARQLTSEVSDARVWGGVHWRFSTRAGEAIGRGVSRAVLAKERRHHHW